MLRGLEGRVEHDIAQAHLAAHLAKLAYHKPGAIPSLEKLTGRSRKSEAPAAQSLEEMARAVRAWRLIVYGPDAPAAAAADQE